MSIIWWIVLIVIIVVFVWISIAKSISAHKKRVESGIETFVGRKGTAKTDINPQGRFYVYGEYWEAEARGEPLKAGDKGRVVDIDQVESKYLIVEKLKE